MPRARFVGMALSSTVAVVVASILLLRPTGAETGSDYGEGDGDAVVVLDSAKIPEPRDTILVVHEDSSDVRAVRRSGPESERLTQGPAATLPVRERGDVGEHLDPDALYLVSSSGGNVVDVGEIEDPEHDVPTAPPYEGVSDIGDYLEPEESP